MARLIIKKVALLLAKRTSALLSVQSSSTGCVAGGP